MSKKKVNEQELEERKIKGIPELPISHHPRNPAFAPVSDRALCSTWSSTIRMYDGDRYVVAVQYTESLHKCKVNILHFARGCLVGA